MTPERKERVEEILFDLNIVGEIADELAQAFIEGDARELPAPWLGWFGRLVKRSVDDIESALSERDD